MEFYDIVSETCAFDRDFEKRLGFKKIFTINKEIAAVGSKGIADKEGSTIAFGRDPNQLLSLVKAGATAIAITDSYIDKKLMDAIKDSGCILCMPMSTITASYGVERSRNIYRMKRLFAYARKQKIPIAFVSMAKDRQLMNSCMQLVELAKLLGADDRYARQGTGETTKGIGGKR